MTEKVILVDEDDNKIGTEEKLKAHQDGGKLHRCFSIFIFNDKGELMLQKRAEQKYHCPDLWTNTCCSHPRPGEPLEEAAHRRIKEEMGFDCPMEEKFTFTYKADFENGLTEHEYDHVYIGKYNGEPDPNPEEAGDWKWIKPKKLNQDIEKNPERYTPWFKKALDKALNHIPE